MLRAAKLLLCLLLILVYFIKYCIYDLPKFIHFQFGRSYQNDAQGFHELRPIKYLCSHCMRGFTPSPFGLQVPFIFPFLSLCWMAKLRNYYIAHLLLLFFIFFIVVCTLNDGNSSAAKLGSFTIAREQTSLAHQKKNRKKKETVLSARLKIMSLYRLTVVTRVLLAGGRFEWQ